MATIITCSSLCLSQACMDEWNHLSELVLFALAMQETLKEINRHSTKNFQLRVGKLHTGDTHTQIYPLGLRKQKATHILAMQQI